MGGTVVGLPNAAHMETMAYGLHAVRKPMQTATESWKETQNEFVTQAHIYFHLCGMLESGPMHLP